MAGKAVKCPACAHVWQVPRPVDAQVVPEPQRNKQWFDDAMNDEYPIAAGQTPFAASAIQPSLPAPRRLTQSTPRRPQRGFFAPERKGIAKGALGGIVMMVIAVVWFVAGFAVGYIFFYPPILFLIGLYAFLKGIMTGNLAGKD
jgi:hypothetical protein